MKKLLYITALSLLLVLTLCTPVFADSGTPRIVDDAGLLTSAEYDEILAKLDELSERIDYDIVIYTTDKSIGSDTELYAADYFEGCGFGLGEERSGTAFVVSMRYRDYAFASLGEGESVSPEYAYGIDTVISYLSDGDYFEAFSLYADAIAEEIIDSREFPIFTYLLIALAVGAAVGLIVVFSMKRKLKSVAPQDTARDYATNFTLTHSRDLYLFSTVNRIRKPQNNGGGGHSSSGRSFSGRSGKF